MTTDTNKINAQSQFLYSLTQDVYKDVSPSIKQTSFSSSLDNTKIEVIDPECTPLYCNGNDRGTCGLIDKYLTCYCKTGYSGENCQIDNLSIQKLQEAFSNNIH